MSKSPRKSIDAIRKALPQIERREIRLDVRQLEIREDPENPEITMRIPYNSNSEDMGFVERIAPGAFARSIRNGMRAKIKATDTTYRDVVSLWNHDPNLPLGRQSNETLRFDDSEEELQAIVTLDPGDTNHQNALRRVQRRDVVGSSFGFEKIVDDWDEEDGKPLRTLVEVRLFDVSPVTFPAYPGSEARSMVDIALRRSGVDLSDLADLLSGAKAGKVAEEYRDRLRAWIRHLESLVPPFQRTDDGMERRLMLHERVLRAMGGQEIPEKETPAEARTYVRPTDGKSYATFEMCVMDNQWADNPEGYCNMIKTGGE